MTRTISATMMLLYIGRLDEILKWTQMARADASALAKQRLDYAIKDAEFIRDGLLKASVVAVEVEVAP